MFLTLLQNYFKKIKRRLLPQDGVTFVSAVILVAVMSLSIWATLVLSDIILKARSVRTTEEEMAMIAAGLLSFYQDCDQFPTDSGDVAVDFLDLQSPPADSRFEGNASLQSYRAGVWDGPYVGGGYNVDKVSGTMDYIDDYLRDAWNSPYIYDYTAGASSATITSYGLNRASGGGDDIVITVTADGIIEEKIRKTKEELSYINAKKDELKSRYNAAGESWPPVGFSIDDLFKSYGADTTGLVSHWKMDENSWNGTSGEVDDSVGSNDGTASGSTTVFTGKIGRAGSFDGVDDYVEIALGHGLLSTEITISMWVYPISWTHQTHTALITSRTTASDGLMFFILSQGNLNFDWGDGSSSYRWDTGFQPLLNQWTHLTIKRDSDGRYLYVNGDLQNSTGIAGGPPTANTILRIGAETTGNSYNYQGLIDEVRIWSRALPPSDVFQEYLRGFYLTDWAYKYDEWQSEYAWDGAKDLFYSFGPDRAAGGGDDIYQSE